MLPVFGIAPKRRGRRGAVPAETWRKTFADVVRACSAMHKDPASRRACLRQSLRATYQQLSAGIGV